MDKFWMLGAVALLATAARAAPTPTEGLVAKVYQGIPSTDYFPTDADISFEQAYAASATPDVTFINTNDSFQYSNPRPYANGATTTMEFLGADAAGPELLDTASNDLTAIDQKGGVVISQAGDYTFSFDSADDAARAYVSGALVAEQDFNTDLSGPSQTVLTLAAGTYAFELFSFQQGGDAFVHFGVQGPGTVSYVTSVPEPAVWSLMMLGFGVAGATMRARRSREALSGT
jgi:hypothetical protein